MKKILQKIETKLSTAASNSWQKFKNLLRLWFTNEWELTVYYNGQSTITGDGHVVTSKTPVTYNVKKIKKLSPKHILFVDTDKRLVEIKVIEPVGYTLKKVW